MNKIRQAIIVTGYNCNNNCLFCSISREKRAFNRDFPEIANDLKLQYSCGCRAVEFIGGEVTIRNDFLSLIRTARKLGYRYISLETNGRMFSDPTFVRRSVSAGLTHVLFSIHGHNDAIHDALTRSPGSYAQAMKGVRNTVKFKKVVVLSNYVINKLNFRFVDEYLDAMRVYRIDTFHFSFVNPQGNALNNASKIIPRISDVNTCLLDAIDRHKGMRIKILNIPPCLLGLRTQQILNSHDKCQRYISSESQKLLSMRTELVNLKHKPAKCQKCVFFDNCDGIWKKYFYMYGSDELRPS